MPFDSERIELSEKYGLNTGTDKIRDVLNNQRNRFLATLEDLPSSAWAAQSRCSEWSVHQVVRHVRDIAKIQVARLGGGPWPFRDSGGFDLRSSPSNWLLESDGETPRETLGELALLVEQEKDLFSSFTLPADGRPRTGPLRRRLHWSVACLHNAADAWMHERDIAQPLGLQVTSGDEELRLMAMYSLLAAAAPAALSGDYLDTCLRLDGPPTMVLRITHQEDDVRVVTGGEPELRGPAHAVLDSLIGRGPQPAEILHASGAAVRKLSLLRATVT
jgi:uncharacterized protein (TIGR03083 family)